MSKDKNSSKDYQEINFNEENRKIISEQLNKIKNNVEKIIKGINNFKSEINNLFDSINKCCKEYIKEFENYRSILQNLKNDIETKKHYTCFINNFHKNFENCNNLYNKLDDENYMNKIYDLNYEIKNTIKDIIELKFYAPKCENTNNSISLSLSTYESDEPFHNKTLEGFSSYENFLDLNQNDEKDNNNPKDMYNNNIKSKKNKIK